MTDPKTPQDEPESSDVDETAETAETAEAPPVVRRSSRIVVAPIAEEMSEGLNVWAQNQPRLFDATSFQGFAAPLIENLSLLLKEEAWVTDSLKQTLTNFHTAFLAAVPTFEVIQANINATVLGFAETIARYDWASLVESIAKFLPPNWPEDLEYGPAMNFINGSGVPIIWVPSAPVVDLLVAAEGPIEVDKILSDHETVIVGDIRLVLDGIDIESPLIGEVQHLREAASVFGSGQLIAAQSLATTTLDAIIIRKYRYHRSAREQIQPITDESGLQSIILQGAMVPLLSALTSYWPSNGDPVPTEYNRHATVHAGASGQFSRRNALVALMLATSVLKTLDYSGAFVEPDDGTPSAE